jgi:hypothetical protein
MVTLQDIDQRITILELLYDEVMLLQNNELSDKLAKFKVDNVQWIFNALEGTVSDLQVALEMVEANHRDY